MKRVINFNNTYLEAKDIHKMWICDFNKCNIKFNNSKYIELMDGLFGGRLRNTNEKPIDRKQIHLIDGEWYYV